MINHDALFMCTIITELFCWFKTTFKTGWRLKTKRLTCVFCPFFKLRHQYFTSRTRIIQAIKKKHERTGYGINIKKPKKTGCTINKKLFLKNEVVKVFTT
jgi:hypothetical protein